jgi:predicted dehydrogenase
VDPLSKLLKIAVIGTGGISKNHLESYQKNPNVEIYALCDINKERVTKMAERFNVPLERTFTDKDEMFKALPEIDAVSVCTWNSAPLPLSMQASMFCAKSPWL